MPNSQTFHLLNKRKAHNQGAKLPKILFFANFSTIFFKNNHPKEPFCKKKLQKSLFARRKDNNSLRICEHSHYTTAC